MHYAASIEDDATLLVPSISIIVYEVQKCLIIQNEDELASKAMILFEQGEEIKIDHKITMYASILSKKHNLSLADSIIYAVTMIYDAILWTQDEHFEGLPNVKYFKKK